MIPMDGDGPARFQHPFASVNRRACVRRVNGVFGAIVVLALLTGGVAAVDYGTELRTVDTISLVERQLDSSITGFRVTGGEIHVTVRLTNPTGYAVRLHGTFVRVFAPNGGSQLAYGAGERVDDGPETVGPRAELTARYRVRLTPDQASAVRETAEAGPLRVRLFHSMTLGEEAFTLVRNDDAVTGEATG